MHGQPSIAGIHYSTTAILKARNFAIGLTNVIRFSDYLPKEFRKSKSPLSASERYSVGKRGGENKKSPGVRGRGLKFVWQPFRGASAIHDGSGI
jgi:hypothetical protein